MQSPVISIPKKQTGDVDWPTPIRHIISISYGENPDNYADECASLQRARQDAVRGAGSDATARDLLYKYFGQLELLELRFPDIKVPFPWHDAFTTKVTTQTSLAFEKASILFLLASTLSSLSADSNRTSPEGLKRAYHYARSAAGILVYINENFLHAPSTDLSKEVVKFLVGIVLAQAQEMFVEKVIDEAKGKEKKKGPASGESMIARLAIQGAHMYTQLGEEVKEFFGKGIIDRNWVGIINVKAKYLQSLAQYHRSLFDASNAAYGPALVRLTLSETLAREANRLAIAFSATFAPLPDSPPTLPHDAATSLLEITKTHLASVSEARVQADRDNDLIYHAILPTEAALAIIEKLEVAKAIPIQEIYKGEEVSRLIGPDVFRRLVPLSVHEGASVYSEEKAKVGRHESSKSESAEAEVRVALESLGLPSGLAKYRMMMDGGGLDALAEPSTEVQDWAREIQTKEHGSESIDSLLKILSEAKGRVERDLQGIQDQLDGESRECESTRAKFSGHFPQAPSATLTKSFRADLRSQQSALASASQSDARVTSLHQSILPFLAILSSSANLKKAYKDAASGLGAAERGSANLLDLGVGEEEKEDGEKRDLKATLAEVEERLGRLNRLKRERAESLKDLKEHLRTDDVSQLLLLNRNRPQASTGQNTQSIDPALFTTELEKFRPYQVRLATAMEHEQTTLDELSRLMEKLRGGGAGRGEMVRKWESGEKKVSELETRLAEAVIDWKEVQGGLRRGLEFYHQIQGMTDSLRQSVRSFVTTRADERSRLLASSGGTSFSPSSPAPASSRAPSSASTANGLERQLSGMSLGTGSGGGGYNSPPPQGSGNSYSSFSQPSSTPYGSNSPYPPLQPSSNSSASYSSTASAYPPPPPPPSSYSSPSPIGSQQQQSRSDPWDFAAMSSTPAFSTAPVKPPTTSTIHSPPSPLPSPYAPHHQSYGQPPPSSHGYSSQQQQQPQRQSSYPAPPTSSSLSVYPYTSPAPPPPPPSNSYHAPAPAPQQQYQPHYAPSPPSHSAPSPYPPPPQQRQHQYQPAPSSYYPPPPPPQPTAYGAYPPPPPPPAPSGSSSQYGGYPAYR